MNFNDVAIDSVKGSDYKIHFWYMSKDNAISIMNSSDLSEKSGLLTFFLFTYNKWVKKLIIKETEMWY